MQHEFALKRSRVRCMVTLEDIIRDGLVGGRSVRHTDKVRSLHLQVPKENTRWVVEGHKRAQDEEGCGETLLRNSSLPKKRFFQKR